MSERCFWKCSKCLIAAITIQSSILKYVPQHTMALFKQRDFILDAVTHNGLALEHLPAAMKADPEIVLAALQRSMASGNVVARWAHSTKWKILLQSLD